MTDSAASGYEERIVGARIVAVDPQGPTGGLLKVEFEHKGTDDDSGFLIVPLGNVYFKAEANATR